MPLLSLASLSYLLYALRQWHQHPVVSQSKVKNVSLVYFSYPSTSFRNLSSLAHKKFSLTPHQRANLTLKLTAMLGSVQLDAVYRCCAPLVWLRVWLRVCFRVCFREHEIQPRNQRKYV